MCKCITETQWRKQRTLVEGVGVSRTSAPVHTKTSRDSEQNSIQKSAHLMKTYCYNLQFVRLLNISESEEPFQITWNTHPQPTTQYSLNKTNLNKYLSLLYCTSSTNLNWINEESLKKLLKIKVYKSETGSKFFFRVSMLIWTRSGWHNTWVMRSHLHTREQKMHFLYVFTNSLKGFTNLSTLQVSGLFLKSGLMWSLVKTTAKPPFFVFFTNKIKISQIWNGVLLTLQTLRVIEVQV